jgi:hypothetical protein
MPASEAFSCAWYDFFRAFPQELGTKPCLCGFGTDLPRLILDGLRLLNDVPGSFNHVGGQIEKAVVEHGGLIVRLPVLANLGARHRMG